MTYKVHHVHACSSACDFTQDCLRIRSFSVCAQCKRGGCILALLFFISIVHALYAWIQKTHTRFATFVVTTFAPFIKTPFIRSNFYRRRQTMLGIKNAKLCWSHALERSVLRELGFFVCEWAQTVKRETSNTSIWSVKRGKFLVTVFSENSVRNLISWQRCWYIFYWFSIWT